MSDLPMRLPPQTATSEPASAEQVLVERAKRDRSAFASLYRLHYRAVAAHIYRRTGNQHVTEDLVADVFLTVLRTLPRYRYRGVPLRHWLLRIATNTVNRWARRRRRTTSDALDAAQVVEQRDPADAMVNEAERQRALAALLSLPPKFQTVLALHYLEGLDLRAVASIIGCRLGTVKSRLSRARMKLRAELELRR